MDHNGVGNATIKSFEHRLWTNDRDGVTLGARTFSIMVAVLASRSKLTVFWSIPVRFTLVVRRVTPVIYATYSKVIPLVGLEYPSVTNVILGLHSESKDALTRITYPEKTTILSDSPLYRFCTRRFTLEPFFTDAAPMFRAAREGRCVPVMNVAVCRD